MGLQRMMHFAVFVSLQVSAVKEEHSKVQEAVEARRQLLKGCDDQLKKLEKEVEKIEEKKASNAVELKKLEHQVGMPPPG